MSGWLPTGVYAWWIAVLGSDWPVIAAPALVCMCVYALRAAAEMVRDAWR